MIARMTTLVAVSALCLAGCAFGPRPYGSGSRNENARCRYMDSTYVHGSTACRSGIQYRCDDGQWRDRGVACGNDQPRADRTCDLNGNAYSQGAAVCQSGTQYRCDDGAWRSLREACGRDGDGGARNGRTCVYKGATVATRSTICRSGSTFLCEDGEWRNLGSACR